MLDPETLTPLTSEGFSADLSSVFDPMGIAVTAELLTTYSWQRMFQTFTVSAGFGWHERTVMGWRAAKDAGERINWMPARYAADFDVTKQILNYTACRAFAMAVNAASTRSRGRREGGGAGHLSGGDQAAGDCAHGWGERGATLGGLPATGAGEASAL